MQTFLPFADFADSAASLDPRRLGKQRVEVLQIVRAITWPKYGWRNHPAANMWRGFETPRTTPTSCGRPGRRPPRRSGSTTSATFLGDRGVRRVAILRLEVDRGAA
jgi:hypothetical protein